MLLMKSKLSAVLLALVIILSLASIAAGESIRGYNKAEGGYQYIKMGEYPFEEDGTRAPVLWRVLQVEDQQAILLSDMILDSKQITFVEDQKERENHKYPDLTDFRDSDLYQWQNGALTKASGSIISKRGGPIRRHMRSSRA